MASCSNLARRALGTDTPVMILMQQLLREAKDCMSLAQGVVYWQPPQHALEKVKDAIWEPSTSNYGPDDGLPQLREALVEKLKRENNLSKSSVMVTQGANQAFVNLVLTLCDPGDSVVMFVPYYFNAYMSFQMTGITNILTGPCNIDTLQPDAVWWQMALLEDTADFSLFQCIFWQVVHVAILFSSWWDRCTLVFSGVDPGIEHTIGCIGCLVLGFIFAFRSDILKDCIRIDKMLRSECVLTMHKLM